ncbi:serine/threonine receptor-like kinase NFP [Durio zibethinus]|uniref:Serine/threonine receptor-like kinase NFP n=1 Tax=Durio zibethinus TaxID=66656 RepID=A0A6P5ZG89_DURZI|nr:serine/threonine receptor-like kinase NFP [Durio zibethinus]
MKYTASGPNTLITLAHCLLSMAISLLSHQCLQVLIFIFQYFFASFISAQSDFSCFKNSSTSCSTYAAYFAQEQDFLDLQNISDLFGTSPQEIAKASNLDSEDKQLFPGQLLLVPITCGCTRKHYFANITYDIKLADTYYIVSTTTFENLTNYIAVEDMNPALDPKNLHSGDKVVFPLFCKCPSKAQLENGTEYLISYAWQPNDNVWSVSAMFNASPVDIIQENKLNNYQNISLAAIPPLMIPVSELPVLSQTHLSPLTGSKSKHQRILLVVMSTVGSLFVFLLVALLFHERKKIFKRNGSSLETVGLIPVKDLTKGESFQSNIIQDKLLPGLSGYLGKPIMYEAEVIMEATMNLDEQCRIGGTVYRATIDGKLLAIKKTKNDVTEELKILQKVNHANLVKLMGVSADSDGNCFLVYEYAENESLDKWLHPKCSSSSSHVAFLTWSQRLQVALDVANGLQYMHEHTQPNIVHRDIRTSNILLDSTFRAKIANFSVARTTTNAITPKVDVFAFGIVLLELLSGKKAMATRENGEIFMLWKNLREVLESEEKKEKRLRKWMDPNLDRFYPINDALSLAVLAMACTQENPLVRPSMAEIVFSLSVLIHSSFETLEGSWSSGVETELAQIVSPVIAR